MSSSDSKAQAELDQTPRSYGVEIEMVFAFHEKQLSLGRTNGVLDKIEKGVDLLIKETRPFSIIPMPNREYNSWGIVRGDSGLGPYDREPQDIVANILDQKCRLQTNLLIAGTLYAKDKKADSYNDWLVTTDHSVCGVGSQNIPKWLPNRVPGASAYEWDSYGIEIVSPVLKSDSRRNTDEIAKIVVAVKGVDTDTYGAFITNQCGMHVHVEAPKEPAVLYTLAYIILIYEDEISRLHPPCRRPEHEAAKGNIESNRLGMMIPKNEDLTKGAFQRLDCSTAVISKRYMFEELLERLLILRGGSEDPASALVHLAILMNFPWNGPKYPADRNRLVNFTSATRRKDYPYTIEFRQARGSLSAEDISRWVDCCVGLVRLADLYMQDPGLIPVFGWEDTFSNGRIVRNHINVFDLINNMELGDDAIRFWETKVARYMCGAKWDADDRTDNEVRPDDDPYSSDSDGGGGGGSGDDDDDDAAAKAEANRRKE
jgi:hypothetical protein